MNVNDPITNQLPPTVPLASAELPTQPEVIDPLIKEANELTDAMESLRQNNG